MTGWLTWARGFGSFCYGFIIGDDWRPAAIVTAALVSTVVLVHLARIDAWWLMPACVIAALGWSLRQATTRNR